MSSYTRGTRGTSRLLVACTASKRGYYRQVLVAVTTARRGHVRVFEEGMRTVAVRIERAELVHPVKVTAEFIME